MTADQSSHRVAPYLPYWRQRQASERSQSLYLAKQARADAERIASMLRRDFGVTRVLLFGSLSGSFLA